MVDSVSYIGSFFLFMSLIAKDRDKFLQFFLIKEIPFIIYAYLIDNNLLISISILSIFTISFEIFKNKIDLTKLNLYSPLIIIAANYNNPFSYLLAFSLFLSFYSAKMDNFMRSKILVTASNFIWLFFGVYNEIYPIVFINIILIFSGIYSILKLNKKNL